MAALRNGQPINDSDFDFNEMERAGAMRRWHAEHRTETAESTMQTGGHRRCDTPRHWKHGRAIRM